MTGSEQKALQLITDQISNLVGDLDKRVQYLEQAFSTVDVNMQRWAVVPMTLDEYKTNVDAMTTYVKDAAAGYAFLKRDMI